MIAIAFSFGGSVVVALVLCSMKYFLNRKPRKAPKNPKAAAYLESISYSSSELQRATSNFHPINMLGRGEYGEVFKGVLEDGTFVAVKKLTAQHEQGTREFMDTVKLITSIQHQNLLKLTGWCLEGGQKLLVYEYLEHRTLDQVLINPETKVNVNWQNRFNIVYGIARGLAYLHESEPKIIHGDIKASNILLDKSFHPKIGDCALRNLFLDEDTTPFSTHVSENLGYVAPEYLLQGQLTEKVDAFSFGVLVLEIISGRSNVNLNFTHDQRLLLEWAWKLYKETRLADLVDPNLAKDYSDDEVFRLIHVALLCTQSSPATRPSMSRVLAMINGDDDITVFPSRPGILYKLLEDPSSQEGPSSHQIKRNEKDEYAPSA